MSPERWDVTRPWRSMRGVPSGWRMIARNWYSVLNASTARTFPRKSSRVRGCGVTMSERSTPIASRVRPRTVKALSSHLRRADREVEGVLAEGRLDHVRVGRGLLREADLEGVRLPHDEVPVGLEHPAELLPRDDVELDDPVLRELEVPPGLLDEVHDLSRVPFREELFGHPRVEVHDAAGEGLLDDVLGDGLDERDHGRIDPDLLPLDPDGVLPLLKPRLDLPGVLGTEEDLDLLGPELVRRAHGVHVDVDVDLHPAPGLVGPDDVELLRAALPDDDLSERAHRIEAEGVRDLDRDAGQGPVPLDPPARLRLEHGLEASPEHVDVGRALLVAELEGPRLLRGEDGLLDLGGDLLRGGRTRVGDLVEDVEALVIARRLHDVPRPAEEVLPVGRLEEPSFREDGDAAHGGVLEGSQGDPGGVRGEQDLPDEVPDPREGLGVPVPRFDPEAERLVDLLDGLDHVQGQGLGLRACVHEDDEHVGPAPRDEAAVAHRRPPDPLPGALGERLRDEGLRLPLEGRGLRRLVPRAVRPALMADHDPGLVEEDRILDRVATLRFDPDGRRVRDLVLRVVEGTGWRPCTSTGPRTVGVTSFAGQFPLFVTLSVKRFQRFAWSPEWLGSRKRRGGRSPTH